jgi:hypothetical protein
LFFGTRRAYAGKIAETITEFETSFATAAADGVTGSGASKSNKNGNFNVAVKKT